MSIAVPPSSCVLFPPPPNRSTMGADDSFYISPTVKELTPSSSPLSSPRKHVEPEFEQSVQIHKPRNSLAGRDNQSNSQSNKQTINRTVCRDNQCEFADETSCRSRQAESHTQRIANGAVYQSVAQSSSQSSNQSTNQSNNQPKACGGLFGMFCTKSGCKSVRLAPVPQFTFSEIRLHNQVDDFWTIVDERVYDLTDYLPIHPGTARLLLPLGGLDATDDFIAMRHSVKASTILSTYWIGNVVGSKYKEPPANAGLALSDKRKAIAHSILKRTAMQPNVDVGEAPPRKKLTLRERFELCWYV